MRPAGVGPSNGAEGDPLAGPSMSSKSQLQLGTDDVIRTSHAQESQPPCFLPPPARRRETREKWGQGARAVRAGAQPAGGQRGRQSGNWTQGHSSMLTGIPKMSHNRAAVSPRAARHASQLEVCVLSKGGRGLPLGEKTSLSTGPQTDVRGETTHRWGEGPGHQESRHKERPQHPQG